MEQKQLSTTFNTTPGILPPVPNDPLDNELVTTTPSANHDSDGNYGMVLESNGATFQGAAILGRDATP